MSRPETADAAVYRTLSANKFGVAFPVLFLCLGNVATDWLSRLAVDYPQLVQQDLATSSRLLEGRRVNRFQQSRHQELVGKHRELPDEVPQLFVCGCASTKPSGIGIIGNDAVPKEFAIDFGEKVLEAVHLLLS
jgi:hypothetical protein